MANDPPTRVIVFEPIDAALIPVGSSDSEIRSASRHRTGSAILEVVSTSDTIFEDIRRNAKRMATNNKEIWQLFPELRCDFKTVVRRKTARDEAQGDGFLDEAIPGDILVDRAVWFYGHSELTQAALRASPSPFG